MHAQQDTSLEMERQDTLDINDVDVEEEQPRLPPFKLGDALCWSSAGWFTTLIGWVYCAVDSSKCDWWVALALVPPVFFVCGVFFEFFVVEKRSHSVICCFQPENWAKTGWIVIAFETTVLSIAGYFIITQGLKGGCPHTTPAEWIVVTGIGCVLILSILKDVFAVLPTPEYALQI